MHTSAVEQQATSLCFCGAGKGASLEFRSEQEETDRILEL